jgi:hypothetical protein
MDVPTSEMPTDKDGTPVPCLDQIFVHPVTGFAYFSCEVAVGAREMFEVDPFHQKVIPVGPPMSKSGARTFLYDPARQWLYLGIGAPEILDVQDRLVGRIGETRAQKVDWARGPVVFVGVEIPGHAGPGESGLYGVDDMALLPDGNLVLLSGISGTPVLILYDPAAHKALQTWTAERTYTGLIGPGRIHGVRYERPTPMQRLYSIQNVPVPSRDGSRLFGIEESESHADGSKPTQDGGIIWDARTLQVLRRWTLPEPRSYDCSQEGTGSGLIACFVPAPDGRGMWFFGQSGKVYRLDDHTGELVEQVKLPFHLVSLIREP